MQKKLYFKLYLFFHLITAFLEKTSGKNKTDSGFYLNNIILLKNSGPLITSGLSIQQSPVMIMADIIR